MILNTVENTEALLSIKLIQRRCILVYRTRQQRSASLVVDKVENVVVGENVAGQTSEKLEHRRLVIGQRSVNPFRA